MKPPVTQQPDMGKVSRGDLVYTKKVTRYLPPNTKIDMGVAPGTSYAVMVIGSIKEKEGLIDQKQLDILLASLGLYNVNDIQEAFGKAQTAVLAKYCQEKFTDKSPEKFKEPIEVKEEPEHIEVPSPTAEA